MAPYWELDSPIPGQMPSRWPLRLLCVNSAADVVSRLHFQLVANGLTGIPFLTQLGCEFPPETGSVLMATRSTIGFEGFPMFGQTSLWHQFMSVSSQTSLSGLAGGEVQFGSVVGGSSGRTLAAPYPSRQGAIPRDDHHLRLDPNVGEGPAETWRTWK